MHHDAWFIVHNIRARMKLFFPYTSHVFLAVLFGKLCIRTQGNTNFQCGNHREWGLFRIIQGSATNQLDGEVQVCDDDGAGLRWYSVCGDNNWNDTTAAIVCQQLGFSDKGAVATSMEDTNGGSIILQCSEFGLEKQSTRCMEEQSCTTLAVVHCEPSQCRRGEIRLRGGDAEQIGRVEICIDQQWGTINENGWSEVEEANIVCGQIGYSNRDATNDNNAQSFGEGTGPTYFRDFTCTGAEERLLDCGRLNDTENDHREDAGVRCMLTLCTDGEVRLVGGTVLVDSTRTMQVDGTLLLGGRPLNGRVEICVGGRWGSVCDNYWNAEDAGVVCNQLGFSRAGAIAVHQSAFGEPVIDPILLNNVQCEGTETNLTECTFRSRLDEGDCAHSETAGVICKVCVNGDVRLVNGSNGQEGRVEVCLAEQWSSICDNSWSEADATVTCRQLGYSDISAVNKSASADFQIGEGIIYLSSLECTGTEARLFECDVGNVVPCNHSMDVGVTCFNKQDTTRNSFITTTTPVSSTKEPPPSSSQSTLVTILGAMIGILVVLLILSTVTAMCALVAYRCRHKGGPVIEEVYDTIPDGSDLNREAAQAVTDAVEKIELESNAAYGRPAVGTGLRQSGNSGTSSRTRDRIEMESNTAYGRTQRHASVFEEI